MKPVLGPFEYDHYDIRVGGVWFAVDRWIPLMLQSKGMTGYRLIKNGRVVKSVLRRTHAENSRVESV